MRLLCVCFSFHYSHLILLDINHDEHHSILLLYSTLLKLITWWESNTCPQFHLQNCSSNFDQTIAKFRSDAVRSNIISHFTMTLISNCLNFHTVGSQNTLLAQDIKHRAQHDVHLMVAPFLSLRNPKAGCVRIPILIWNDWFSRNLVLEATATFQSPTTGNNNMSIAKCH